MATVHKGKLSEQYILNACFDNANNRIAAQPSTYDDTSSPTSKGTLTEYTMQEILNRCFVANHPTYGDHLRLY